MTNLTAAERFWGRVTWDPTQASSCIEWTAGKTSVGYGLCQWRGRLQLVHRIAFEALVGPIPAGLEIDHLCRNRACVNPDHLEAVTKKENILRGESAPAKNARKTACKRGHPFTPGNIMWSGPKRNERKCRACDRLYRRDEI